MAALQSTACEDSFADVVLLMLVKSVQELEGAMSSTLVNELLVSMLVGMPQVLLVGFPTCDTASPSIYELLGRVHAPNEPPFAEDR